MTTKDLIDARPETIGTLINFSSNTDTIIVPSYQRPYQWDTSRTIDIVKLSDPDSKDFGFIGTMVFVRNKEQKLEVVDGQQRLITIILILCAFRDFLDDLSSSVHNDKVSNQLQEMMRDIQNDSLMVYKSYSSTEAKPRIEFRRSAFDTFKNFYLKNDKNYKPEDDVSKNELKSLEKNYSAVRQYFDEKYNSQTKSIVALLDRRLTKLKGLVVNTIYISKPELAGEVFESINGTGVNLKLSELVKNYIFRNVNSSAVEGEWEKINHNCDQKNPLIENIIKYDWQSRHDISDDFETFRSIRANTLNVEIYFNRLIRLSKIISFYLHPSDDKFKYLKLADNSNDKNHIIRYATVLRTLQVKQFLRVIFALDALREYIDIKQYVKLLELLVNFQVRVKVANIGTNNVDNLYSNFARTLIRLHDDIESGTIPKDKAKDRIASVLFNRLHTSMKKLSPDNEFIDAFARLERPKSNKDVFKYLLSKIENHLQRNELVIDVLDNQITLEEIYPQTPSEKWNKSNCTHEDTYKIGNATILTSRDNKIASNHTITDKLSIYKLSSLKLNKQLVKHINGESSWSSEKIESRGEELAQYASDIWSL